jgi:hypothetical protein
MFKLILTIAILSVAVHGQSGSEEASSEVAEAATGTCNSVCGGKTKIKLEIEVPSGCGGGGGSLVPAEDLCLGAKNSKKISKCVLNVLHQNPDHSYQILKDLKIIEFVYSTMRYGEWADNIKENDFDYVGYPRCQKLVSKFTICKKVCKVYASLRKALREHAADAVIETYASEEGNYIEVTGELILLGDAAAEVESRLAADATIKEVRFLCKTFIADGNLMNDQWHGINVYVESREFIVPIPIYWDVTTGKSYEILISLHFLIIFFCNPQRWFR